MSVSDRDARAFLRSIAAGGDVTPLLDLVTHLRLDDVEPLRAMKQHIDFLLARQVTEWIFDEGGSAPIAALEDRFLVDLLHDCIRGTAFGGGPIPYFTEALCQLFVLEADYRGLTVPPPPKRLPCSISMRTGHTLPCVLGCPRCKGLGLVPGEPDESLAEETRTRLQEMREGKRTSLGPVPSEDVGFGIRVTDGTDVYDRDYGGRIIDRWDDSEVPPSPCLVCGRVAPLDDGECPDCRH